ncbi:hypothetical protein [Ammoniphilus sp. CFH 90114]|uniref:hypothetical protein n=1 Tax=Ammoniphilus sp. CFH 90114 TaxID=2493665 RepID=UPI00100DAEAF|nr:hypothetical protein [Ammoniphilus sp. CFH 90114]RXT04133.1 hypothetical protein EIZ39_21375 [Ammoniphilus sp. CFH 90114]
MKYTFIFDDRIELDMPVIYVPVEQWDQEETAAFFEKTQGITSQIPAKIQEFDKRYMQKYEELQHRPESFFEIMDELNELSGKISELNVLYLRIEGTFLHAGGHF